MYVPSYKIVAIGASAGGINAISKVLASLGSNFPVGIVVVQHLPRQYPSYLAHIFGRITTLTVKEAANGDLVRSGSVLIAPPNYHVLINSKGVICLSQTAKVNYVRPSVDVLFESIAQSYQQKAIAIILSGTGIDGKSGVWAIAANGGKVIVQSPQSSQYKGMPEAAISTTMANYIVPLDLIAPTLEDLVSQ
jgi:two-component system, chemotaxis family, protein-glutamate methylesterase/glutaminase